MDTTLLIILTSLWSSICVLLIIFLKNHISYYYNPKSPNLPPGPPPLPIIGNILEIGKKPHQSLTSLSRTYGPIFTLKLGRLTSIVISSPQIAKEALQKNDHIFSGRTIPHAARTHDHHEISIAFMDPSPHWRALRKSCATTIFSPHQIASTQNLRHKKLQELLHYVNECCVKCEAMDIGEAAFTVVLNSLTSAFFSTDFAGFASDSSREFKDLIWGLMEETGRPNVADFFPFLRILDPQRARWRMDRYAAKFFQIIGDIVEERMRVGGPKKEPNKDVLDSLLSLMEQDGAQLSRLDVVHLFGSVSCWGGYNMEWAMSGLLANPEKLGKLKKELKQVISKDEKLQESHISKLPYLRAIVKETLRLHPPAPFLVPHKAQSDAEICGFRVPKNAQILVNIWGMGRDSSIWSNDPNQFMPERFLLENTEGIDYKGRDFELIPFGAGRRICPGLPLASIMVHLMLISLVKDYDWKLANGIQPNEIDMEEKFGLTLRRNKPLQAIPIKV
ncbi:geraniol 8-hydroxylase-like [Senna tora]|uniref:Geraniol 8-hydroxylase-like n=1 Tax=Senna tora TaxID=362788 RepID=A0A834XG54_9FABA|nr:geraniol 8-hydroxylase-like [Senna tora]